jgi:hypothetical protein
MPRSLTKAVQDLTHQLLRSTKVEPAAAPTAEQLATPVVPRAPKLPREAREDGPVAFGWNI